MVTVIIIIGLALAKKKEKKYSHDQCAVSWGETVWIPMHLQSVQAINMSNTFHMFTITKSCNVSLEDLR